MGTCSLSACLGLSLLLGCEGTQGRIGSGDTGGGLGGQQAQQGPPTVRHQNAAGQGGGAGPVTTGSGPDVPAAICGDGIVQAPELCDGSTCPAVCDDMDACTQDALLGGVATCDARCEHTPVTACAELADGCCPPACSSLTDGDCDPVCGNGVVEEGEACDGVDCPSSCDDMDMCTEDTLVGDAASCTASCEHIAPPGCRSDYARGATVAFVTLDQGVRIDIVSEGEVVPPSERNAPLVARRPAFLRAFWDLDADWQGRELRAELTLTHADGEEEMLEASARVDAASQSYGELSDGFAFELAAEQMTPEMSIAVALYEVDDTRNQEPLPDPPPRMPLDPEDPEARLPLDINDTYMKMRVVMVPLDHDLDPACPGPPDLDANLDGADGITEGEYIRQRIFAHNPVDEVEMLVHEPVRYTGPTADPTPIFTLLRQLRQSEGTDPEWYYFALIAPCDRGPGFAGVATLGRPTRQAAVTRSGWGVWADRGRSAHTVVHELGHQMGREHVACRGNEASVDRNYPNGNGETGSWGWDVFSTDRIYDPERHDYMGYCNSTWVSQYGWNFVYPYIETLSSWEQEQFLVQAEEPAMLYIAVNADGSVNPWIGRGGFTPPEGPQAQTHSVAFYAGASLLSEHAAQREDFPETTGHQLTVPLPEDFDRATHLVFRDGPTVGTLDTKAIQRVR